MDQATVLVKSTKGRHEIENSARTITENARRILVMVDGQLTVGQLLKKAAIFHNVEQEIEQLLRAGYIVPAGDVAAAPAAQQPAAVGPGGGSISATQRKIIEQEFVEFAGPIASLLCEEIFAAANGVDEAVQRLSRELSAQQASQFRQKVARQLQAG